jgi:hypothetical protein
VTSEERHELANVRAALEAATFNIKRLLRKLADTVRERDQLRAEIATRQEMKKPADPCGPTGGSG